MPKPTKKPRPNDNGDAPDVALRRSEAQMRAILNTTVDGIVTIDEAGVIESFNAAAERIFGYPAEEIIGRSVTLLMPETEGKRHHEYVESYLSTGEAKIIGLGREVVGRRKDGSTFPLDLAVSEVNVGDRRFFTGIARDITERKRVEGELRAEQDFVSAILETVGALIVVLDADGRIVRFNRACERTTGYTFAEVKGQAVWDLFVEPDEVDQVRAVFSRLQDESWVNRHENYWVARDGERRLISWSNTRLAAEDGTTAYVIATGIDVTGRRQAEKAIVLVSEAERQVIGQELHDALGQQLTGIALLTKALERKLKIRSGDGVADAAQVSALASSAIEDAKRLAHGLYPTELEKHGLSASLQELVETQVRIFRVSCTYEGGAGIPPFDKSASLHLYRIVQEATNNAIRHGKAQHIRISLGHEDTGLVLRIRDDGSGFPDELPESKGMGLTIMKYRANAIGGTFGIARRPEGGTMVTCTIPGTVRPATGEVHYEPKSQ